MPTYMLPLGDAHDPLWTADQRKHISRADPCSISGNPTPCCSPQGALLTIQLTRVLRACSIVSFRYNVIGDLATNEQERVYNSVAEKISKEQLKSATDIIRALRLIYPADERFRAAFSEKQIRTTSARNRQVMRYILFGRIERHLSNQAFDYASDKYTIEHILPEHPDENWASFTDEQVDRCVYRIGNLTPLGELPEPQRSGK